MYNKCWHYYSVFIKQNNAIHRSYEKQIHTVWYKYRAITPRILHKHSKVSSKKSNRITLWLFSKTNISTPWCIIWQHRFMHMPQCPCVSLKSSVLIIIKMSLNMTKSFTWILTAASKKMIHTIFKFSCKCSYIIWTTVIFWYFVNRNQMKVFCFL